VKSNDDKAFPCFRPFWRENVTDKCVLLPLIRKFFLATNRIIDFMALRLVQVWTKFDCHLGSLDFLNFAMPL
jgi:hypothetical protein